MIPAPPPAWAAAIPKAGAPIKPHVPAPGPAPDAHTLRQRLADLAKGKRGEGWESIRRAAKGERMLKVHGSDVETDAPLALGVDDYITRQIVWPLANDPDWFDVDPAAVADLFAASLGIMRADCSRGASATGAKFTPEEFARKFAQAAAKAAHTHHEATAFTTRLIEGIGRAADEAPGDPAWRAGLITSGTAGKPTTGAHNVKIILGHHPEIAGKLAQDARSGRILITGPLPWNPHATPGTLWSDAHSTDCAAWIEQEAFFTPKSSLVWEGVGAIARANAFDPFEKYLESLTWDGRPRLTRWLTTYAGAAPTPYHDAIGPAWIISAVARALAPGSKVDTMLVLEGPQGAFKSTLLRVLAGDAHFTDQIPDITTKDAKDALQGPVIVEVAEMEALSRREVAAVKAFLTITVDRFRPAYGRSTEERPRRCVFAGTTNPDGNGYLRDVTGGRRFWCVAAGRCDVEAMRTDRDQIWAEATHRYRAGEKWYLSGDLEKIAAAEAEARREQDPWEQILVGISSAKPDENGRARYRAVEFIPGQITSAQALAMVGIDPAQQDRGKQMRLGQTLRALGWTRTKDGFTHVVSGT